MNLNSQIPEGPLADKWENHRFSSKLVNPANKRKFKLIVVGSDWPEAQPQHSWRTWLQCGLLLLSGYPVVPTP